MATIPSSSDSAPLSFPKGTYSRSVVHEEVLEIRGLNVRVD
jgi:hypothetical protein